MAKTVKQVVGPASAGGKEFRLPKHDYQSKHKNTQDISIVFSNTDGITVEWLDISTNDLPEKDSSGYNYIWVNYFNVKKNGQPLKAKDGVTYTVFLPDDLFGKKDVYFVYFDGTSVKTDKTPSRTGSQPQRAGFVQVDFNIGDPGTGWGGGGTSV